MGASWAPPPPRPEPGPPLRPSAPQDLSPSLISAWTELRPSRYRSESRLTSPTCVELSSVLRDRQPQLLSLPASNLSCWESTLVRPQPSQAPGLTWTTLRFPANRRETGNV